MNNLEKLNNRMQIYMQKYGDDYNQLENDLTTDICTDLKNYILDNYYMAYADLNIEQPLFDQIFSAIGILPKDRNPYYQMMLEIEKEYGLDRDIIEVGSGMFPALAYEIAKRQKEIGKGSITAIDPKSVTKTLDGVKIVKEHFNMETPVDNATLIIARKPCAATESIVRLANKSKIEFYMSLCLCHDAPKEFRIAHKELGHFALWPAYIKELAQSTLPNDFTLEEGTIINPINGNPNNIIKTKKR